MEMELFHGTRPRACTRADAGAVEQLVHQSRQSAATVDIFSDVPARRSGSLSGDMSMSSAGRRSSSSVSLNNRLEEILVDMGPECAINQPAATPPSEVSTLSDGDLAREQLERKFNVRQACIRGFAAVCAAVLLVMACLTLAHKWKMLNFWEALSYN